MQVNSAVLDTLAAVREPHAFFCSGEDNLRVSSWNSVATVTTLTISGRRITPDGLVVPFSERHTPNTNRTIAQSLHSLGEGWIQNLRVTCDGAPQVAQVFVRIEIVRGLVGNVLSLAVLAQGFCNAVQALVWPGSPIIATVDRPGALRTINGTDPAAGSEVSETVPTGARWRLLALRVSLQASAAAANRQVMVKIDDGVAVEIYRGESTVNQIANELRAYNVATLSVVGASLGGDIAIPFPPVVLLAASRILTVTTNLQAGDNWGVPGYLVEEWLEAAA